MSFGENIAPLVGRCMIAALFVLSGVNKLQNWDSTTLYMAEHGVSMIQPLLALSVVIMLYAILNNKLNTALPLDGVTGRIRLTENNTFWREGIPASFRYGRALTPEALVALEAQKAAAKAAEAAVRRATIIDNATAAPAR